MQYVNDDMDELFRRAAEEYPLDTKSADWNKVVAAMQGQTETKTISESKRNKNGRFLWLLLLLPLGLICNQLYSPGTVNDNAVSKAGDIKESPVIEKKNIQKDNTTRSNNIVKTNAGITNNNSVKLENVNSKESNQISGKNIVYSTKPSVQFQKTSYSSKPDFSKKDNKSYIANNNGFHRQAVTPDVNDNSFINEATSFSRSYVSEITSLKKLQDGFSVMANRSLIPSINSSEEISKQKTGTDRKKKFYLGLMGGIDATTIKFQKIENAGFTYGLLSGYQLNKKWSIETGVYLEKKYYYSEGKYFNTSKIYMAPNSWINDVSGNCKMIEVPVLIKYNFSSHENSGWFATAGSSSYFMKKENYDYNYFYGTTGPVAHHKEYKNSTNNLFSNISLSGGYTHTLGNFADLRIEPYLKLPVSGMGIGSLPLFSTGLQVGITKKF